ncbi:hypothetical protein E5288_WYG015910 [Bos mutus]|uniref:Uncharacterized protein n=1 Tax=Bos mutus TaxID=72004 RepID=A0A6B0RPI4_9CETA|nr:hypothetical protein [Bos mutus]
MVAALNTDRRKGSEPERLQLNQGSWEHGKTLILTSCSECPNSVGEEGNKPVYQTGDYHKFRNTSAKAERLLKWTRFENIILHGKTRLPVLGPAVLLCDCHEFFNFIKITGRRCFEIIVLIDLI